MYPIVAIMATRPCLISTARRRLKVASFLSAARPRGSQKPTGSCTPSSVAGSKLLYDEVLPPPPKNCRATFGSRARSGESVYRACAAGKQVSRTRGVGRHLFGLLGGPYEVGLTRPDTSWGEARTTTAPAEAPSHPRPSR